MISVFTLSVLMYITSTYYFYTQEKNLKSTFVESVKDDIKSGLIAENFSDTLVNDKGDTIFVNIPADMANSFSYQALQEDSLIHR